MKKAALFLASLLALGTPAFGSPVDQDPPRNNERKEKKDRSGPIEKKEKGDRGDRQPRRDDGDQGKRGGKRNKGKKDDE